MTTRRDFLRTALGCGGLALTGWATLRRDEASTAARAAAQFLSTRQSPDGAWRSAQYSAFYRGDTLTPLILSSIDFGSEDFARGLHWLGALVDSLPADEPWTTLTYPLFTAAYGAQVFALAGDFTRAVRCVEIIDALRISPALGWPADDPACGAWSDSPTPPRRLSDSGPVPDMIAPNLSATVLALQALVAAGRASDCALALPFIQTCQNYTATQPSAFDDGGFFFTPADPIRNKAGIAGHDRQGRQRFHSYGSATCDGALALRACQPASDPARITAAESWIATHTRGLAHAGAWSPGRATARASLTYYHVQALAEVVARAPHLSPLCRPVVAELLAQQTADGSWSGPAVDSCEDDPLVATAFALRALTRLQAPDSA